MQYRGFLLSVAFCVLAINVNAQKHDESFGPKRTFGSTDPIIRSTPAQHQPLLAMTLPAQEKQQKNILTYKPVPLAGQKAYFGEMNDYVNNFVRQYLLVHNQT